MIHRRWALALVVSALLPSAWLAWEYRDLSHLGLWHDDAVYLVSAKALAEKGEYRMESLPGEPWQTKYPPAYPAALSVLNSRPAAQVWFTWLWLPALLVLCWRLWGRWGLGDWQRAVLCAAIALQPVTVLLATSAMAELPFTAALVAVVLLAESEAALWAGAMAGAAFLLRTSALPLLVMGPICYGLSRKWRLAGKFVAGMLPAVTVWQIWAGTHAARGTDLVTLYYTNYARLYRETAPWSDLGWMLWVNFNALVSSCGKVFFFERQDGIWSEPLGWVFAVAAGAGIWRLIRDRKRYFFPVCAAGMAALLVIWLYPPDRRFVFPLFPLLAAGLALQARQMLSTARGRATRIVLTAAGGAALATLAYGSLRIAPEVLSAQRELRRSRAAACGWIAANTPRDTVLWAYDNVPVYLETGRKTVDLPVPSRLVYRGSEEARAAYARDFVQFGREQRIEYVLVTAGDFRRDLHESGQRGMAQALAGSPVVFRSPGAVVYAARARP